MSWAKYFLQGLAGTLEAFLAVPDGDAQLLGYLVMADVVESDLDVALRTSCEILFT